ncbi:MAG: NAD(P)H-hydrate dehydratase [Bryobacterales bacterium]|nr:NAD(P)H-hydrate dehydratase [Bryobacterales bacterium]
MKILTAAQIRRLDRQTIDSGFTGLLLMENAGHRVVESLGSLGRRASSLPLSRDTWKTSRSSGRVEPLGRSLREERIVIFCGKGNNGGDGLVVARHLLTRYKPASLHVLLAAEKDTLKGDAAENLRFFEAVGGCVSREITPEMHAATLLVDALLGTGLDGPAREPALSYIREWNRGFPLARRIAIDVPSGMSSDGIDHGGDYCRVDGCVTFTALRVCHAIPPFADACGEVVVGDIGTPRSFLDRDPELNLSQIDAEWLHFVARPRERSSHKGDYGHVLVLGGSRAKPGAVGMASLAALRSGAGLTTVATVASAVDGLMHIAPELMAAPLAESVDGFVDAGALHGPAGGELIAGKTVLAVGPGLGVVESTRKMLLSLMDSVQVPLVLDADALNILAAENQWPRNGLLVLTPHPGEMARLMHTSTADIQVNRVNRARELAVGRNAIVVLKGERTVIAFPDNEVWINPTGSPAMATAGSGDVLTGTVASMVAQYPSQPKLAVAAAVYIHGLAGELGALDVGEASLMATDLLRYYPQAIAHCAAS